MTPPCGIVLAIALQRQLVQSIVTVCALFLSFLLAACNSAAPSPAASPAVVLTLAPSATPLPSATTAPRPTLPPSFTPSITPLPTPAVTATPDPSIFAVDFDNNRYEPLVLTHGPGTKAGQVDTTYTVEIKDGQAHFVMPAHPPGLAYTGMLNPPLVYLPIRGDMSFQWTFPNAAELLALGGSDPQQWAIAALYMRGNIGDWLGGAFGDYWFGYNWDAQGAQSVIRQGDVNLISESFTGRQRVTYRVEKKGLQLTLWAQYDDADWHAVGTTEIRLKPNGSDAVHVTHVRVADTSGAAVSITADDFRWTGIGSSPATSTPTVSTPAAP